MYLIQIYGTAVYAEDGSLTTVFGPYLSLEEAKEMAILKATDLALTEGRWTRLVGFVSENLLNRKCPSEPIGWEYVAGALFQEEELWDWNLTEVSPDPPM
ncbi:hypothetical protein BH11PAT3_BH11PAT3_1200 [soil metagenome]